MSALAEIIDGLGITGDIPDGSLVSGAIVVLTILDEDGDESLAIRWSQGLSWITRAGMLHHAIAEETKDGDDE